MNTYERLFGNEPHGTYREANSYYKKKPKVLCNWCNGRITNGSDFHPKCERTRLRVILLKKENLKQNALQLRSDTSL